MISLCSKTLSLAEKKTNFSEWVRSQLLKENETVERSIKWTYECEDCATTWISKHLDNYFYCRNMMNDNGKCHNRTVLIPVQRRDEE